jgi:DNA-binding response OmpR family regulator
MATVALLCPDLLFGSKVEGALRVAGHEVTRYDSDDRARSAARGAEVLVVDLNDERYDGAALVESLRSRDRLDDLRTVGFYAHTDQDTRRRAVEAGYDVVVPRSRMARETAAVVEGSLAR